jgi:hypothetical protein
MQYTSTIALTLLLLVPQIVLGQQYQDPEQVLFEQLFELPPTKREAGGRAQLQAKRSADRRTAIQEEAFGLHAAASNEPKEEDKAAAEEKSHYSLEEVLMALIGALKGGVTPSQDTKEALETRDLTTPEGRREARIDARVAAYEHGLRAEVLAEIAKEESLHRGAPLADTGAGTVVAVILGLGAIGWTLKKATIGGRFEEA